MSYMPGGDALRRRTHYVTTNAAGVRDYVAGDSINRIHWPLSAKRQRLVVKEFELDPLADVWVAVDLYGPVQQRAGESALDVEVARLEGAGGEGEAFQLPPDTEEYAISVAASVAQHFLQQDRVVGLIAYGKHRELIQGERGERQSTKIMETLSVVRAEGEIPFDRVLATETLSLSRGMTLVAISPSPDAAWALVVQHAVRSGLRVVAIVIDGASFGRMEPSDAIIAALADSGAIVRVVRYGEPIPQAIEAQ
jgi:uncharacterized protein (DUF58 family)